MKDEGVQSTAKGDVVNGRRHPTSHQPSAFSAAWAAPGQERRAKRLVRRPVPNILQALLGGVAERVVFITMLRIRRDAAWQRAAIGGEIHQRPWLSAQRPRRAVFRLLETEARLRGCARR
jgi:hypothetical protein